MSTWTSVSKLSVILASGYQNCNIYANGRNRIGVTINVEPIDEKGNSVQVDPQHLVDNLWLIDYVDESTLNWKGSSGWAYTDAANKFTATPGGFSEEAEASANGAGTQQVTFYVYCSPGTNPKSIGVRVRTDSGSTINSSLNGKYHSKVTFNPQAATTYMKGDINWEYSHTSTKYGDNKKYVTTDAWNYYLSLKSANNYFVTFSVSAYFSESGYDGFFACNITPDSHHKNFYGGYVWYQEPHDSAYYSSQDGYSSGEIVNFPAGNKWWDYAKIYDRKYPERYLCFTWVHSTTGGDGWHIPNGPLDTWKEWFRPSIVAYDMYGNTGTFWVDGSDITGALNIYDHQL
ncbi:hypothetical protein KQY30_07750 [Streptomyces sp. GMY02]|uniref:hypothetical protein n=1 Tax=Streptomyces sp. GMY02 TaxID=1333528 RepID=UPI001C2C27D1|nr:hypothetical protein [Streptomyces sp. GMY02]QXE34196.1 hypothetical protein KQY30_07750 [Streptomyces sp. GMY02]